MALGEATEILGFSKFTIDTLIDAGVLCRATSGEGLRPRLDRASVLAFSSWIRALPEGDGHTGRDIRSIWALLHKLGDGRASPFPGQTYPATSVTGVPSAVKPFRTATRSWNSAT